MAIRASAPLTAVLVITSSLSLTACSSPITAPKLAAAVGPEFARMYTEQQHRLGQATPTRGPDSRATCTRAGGRTPHASRGAGDDWSCAVIYPFPDGHLQPITYEVTVAPTGCYTANGPSAVVGGQSLRTAAGSAAVNPLFAFDGCLEL